MALGLTISGRVQAGLEFAVGVMIVFLGAQTLWQMYRDRVHVHVHEHDGAAHLHLHSHAADTVTHRESVHDHTHRATNLRALVVGLVHGAAGSGALLALTISATETLGQALAYFAVFGLGSMAGMAAVSMVASFPLSLAQRSTLWVRRATGLSIGCAALWVGAMVMFENGQVLQSLAQ